MSVHPKTLIGPYIQLHRPLYGVDLDFILNEQFKGQMWCVPSESFDVNYTIVVSNIQDKMSIKIDSDYQEGSVWNLEDLDIEKVKTKFENKFKNVIDTLNEHYEEVKIRYGIIHYWL
jgi:hypothetical protein